jgi:hypothetical protein
MFDFFYNFHNKPLGFDLYTRDSEDGTPPPITSVNLLTENGNNLLTENGIPLLTE